MADLQDDTPRTTEVGEEDGLPDDPFRLPPAGDLLERARALLAGHPVADGYSGLPWALRHLPGHDLQLGEAAVDTDLPRMRAGHVGGSDIDPNGSEATAVTETEESVPRRFERGRRGGWSGAGRAGSSGSAASVRAGTTAPVRAARTRGFEQGRPRRFSRFSRFKRGRRRGFEQGAPLRFGQGRPRGFARDRPHRCERDGPRRRGKARPRPSGGADRVAQEVPVVSSPTRRR